MRKEMDKMPELWDVYDIDRVKTGRTAVRGEALAPGDMHLVIHICIFGSDGRLLIQQRQPWKTWPEYWDVTVGGSALLGENSRQAAHRELLEELGLDIDFTTLRPTFTHNFDEGFDDFYILVRDVDIHKLRLQPEEVKSVAWATADEVFRMMDEGRFIPFYKSFVQSLFDLQGKTDFLNM